MSLMFTLSVALTLSCSQASMPPWVAECGPGAPEFWRRASGLRLEDEPLRALIEGIAGKSQRTEEVRELIETIRMSGVDLVALLQETVEAKALPKGRPVFG